MPEALISRETLTYLGLSVSKGDEVWHGWTIRFGREIDPAPDGYVVDHITFIKFIFKEVTGEMGPWYSEDTTGESDAEWRERLDNAALHWTPKMP
ncbi:hypothetical protein QBC35DRAFT_454633 [Podospora australis]|uniref:Uncharacterized protein n=1 Tax=Podospora australis TaxID=1536484 RepID=A0AAN6WN81_9PEZI|nr:hypothetical protein QBC35DRAFT_454633 [Podospora australis]